MTPEILSYYDQGKEAQRLFQGTGQLELARTQELLQRLLRFAPKEKLSLEKWQKECRIQQQAGQLIDQQTRH